MTANNLGDFDLGEVALSEGQDEGLIGIAELRLVRCAFRHIGRRGLSGLVPGGPLRAVALSARPD
jgi:hypothetical protein